MSGKSPGLPVSLWQFSPPLFSVFIDARNALQDDVLTTLLALNAQSYRNIEVFLSVPPGWETNPHWTECCRTLRGLSYLTNDDADDCRIWRGDYAVAIKPGSRVAPYCFAHVAIALNKNSRKMPAKIILLKDEAGVAFLSRHALIGKMVPRSLSTGAVPMRFRRVLSLGQASRAEIEATIETLKCEPNEAIPRRLVPEKSILRRWKRSALKRYWKFAGRDNEDGQWMARSGLFDRDWYLLTNPDVRAAGVDPFSHYMSNGWHEGRLPTRWFTREFAGVFGFGREQIESPIASIAKMKVDERHDLLKRMRRLRAQTEVAASLLPGLCVFGHLRSVIGLGQAARNLGYAADADRIPLAFHDVPPASKMATDEEYLTKCGLVQDRLAALHVFDAVSFVRYFGNVCPRRTDILYPFWELGRLPKDSKEFAEAYDEIWAPSSFVADTFRAECSRPVSVLSQPVRIPVLAAEERTGPFRFLMYMDFDSYPARKNPEGPVNAFCRAFAGDRRDVRLSVKIRGHNDAGRRQWLLDAASRDTRIEVIDRTLARSDMDQLVMSCDAFISLHRSEGFGFGPAEALAAGKPVVSTDFSATTDFITPETGYPVAYRTVPVAPDSYVDWKGQVWAEPDIDDAVRALREIVDDPDAARARGMRGRQLMIDRFSPEAVGRQMRKMLLERGLIDI